MTATAEKPELPADVQAILNDARSAIREANRVQPGARVHDLHSQMHGVQMHIDSIERDNNLAALERLPGYVTRLRQTLAQLRSAPGVV